MAEPRAPLAPTTPPLPLTRTATPGAMPVASSPAISRSGADPCGIGWGGGGSRPCVRAPQVPALLCRCKHVCQCTPAHPAPCSGDALAFLPPQLRLFDPADMIETFLRYIQRGVCELVRAAAAAGKLREEPGQFSNALPGVSVEQGDGDELHQRVTHKLHLARHPFAPLLQFQSGKNIRTLEIPYLPPGISALSSLLGTLPLAGESPLWGRTALAAPRAAAAAQNRVSQRAHAAAPV